MKYYIYQELLNCFNMKLAIMQPYLFPYIGYFQLLNWADTFVIYDDVQFIKRGWINRNNLLISNKKNLFCLSVKHDSQFLNICDRVFDVSKYEREKIKLLKSIHQSYHKAPFFEEVFDIVKDIFECKSTSIVDFVEFSLKEIMKYLDISTTIVRSSTLDFDKQLKSQDRILSICRLLGTDHYVNPIGGRELYSKDKFKTNNIDISFIKTSDIQYKQFTDEFVPFLSIIDVMMFNSKKEISELLGDYKLV